MKELNALDERITFDPLFVFFGDKRYKAEEVGRALIAWMPFNFFKGPNAESRSDDPHGNFENRCEPIIGEQHFRDLRAVRDDMEEYVRTNTILYFRRAMDRMELLLNRVPNGYRDFTLDDWQQTDNKRVGLKNVCVFQITQRANNKKRRWAIIDNIVDQDRNKRSLDDCGRDGALSAHVCILSNDISCLNTLSNFMEFKNRAFTYYYF